jgi:hypothetical protein
MRSHEIFDESCIYHEMVKNDRFANVVQIHRMRVISVLLLGFEGIFR